MTEFMGYIRPDGAVGVRNHVLLLSGTVYANRLCDHVANMIYNAVSITHPNGRCQVAPDLRITRRFLSGTGANPNVAAVIVVDHFREEGCTADDIAHDISPTGKLIATVNIRSDGGFISALEKAMRYAADFSRQVSDYRRETVPLSKLLFATECGTSDTTSGLASNPATGVCSDMIIAEGGRTILAECTEWMGCENWLTERAVNEDVAERILAGVQHMEQRALASGEDIRGSQPTGDNIIGGLTTIEEKSMGACKKAGNSPIIDYLEIAQPPTSEKPGLYVMYGPGHGAESISSMAAAGAQIQVFCTGGGHTSSHPIMPTIKITGNAESYRLMKDTVDVDVSDVLRGDITMQEAGKRLFDEVIAVANGRLTKSEVLKDDNSFAIHRIGPSI
ncbi:MAG: UxaA family hydrolase [Anaerolineae bacterium]|jgi:altronate dehydratase large subunit|nr:UxaA family hydrolase [Anaerolineae bacterium]